MKVIYLHGLGSSGQSSTAKALEALGIETIAPTYRPERFKESIDRLTPFVEEASVDCIVGTSLGGYYALKLAELTGKRVVAVNACFEPSLYLQKYLDAPAINYDTGEPIHFSPAMLSEFEPLNSSVLVDPVVVIGSQDEVIKPEWQRNYCMEAGWKWIWREGWGHRVDSVEELVEMIGKARLLAN